MSEFSGSDIITEEQFTQNFFDSVVEYQQLLDMHPEDQLTGEMKEGIIEDLDRICPYIGERVFVNGFGVVPSFDGNGEWDGDAVARTHADAEFGIHVGTAIIPDPENTNRPLIVHQIFQSAEKNSRGLTCFTTNQYMSYFDMNSSITLLDQLESALRCENGEDAEINPLWSEKLGEYTRSMYRLVRSTQFRRKNKRTQQAQIERLTYEAEKSTAIRDKRVILMAGYGYVSVRTPEKRNLVPVDISEGTIEGTCLGLISLDLLRVRGKAIRNDGDRPDELAGLCFVVEPSAPVRETLQLDSKEALYVPTGQEMSCEVL